MATLRAAAPFQSARGRQGRILIVRDDLRYCRREGHVADGGALIVRTGVHTGRSPNDKFFVEDSETKGRIDWGKTNKPITPEKYRALYNRMIAYAQRRDLFVRDCWGGADPAHRIGPHRIGVDRGRTGRRLLCHR